MSRTMYDSVDAGAIPVTAQMVAGYIDGAYVWSQADWARFPTATKVTIATSADTLAGDVLDVETGDATVAQCRAWVEARMIAGLTFPTIYCARSAMVAVANELRGLPWELWVADWTGEPHPVAGAAAVQYADSSTSGGHFDLSLVTDDMWFPAATPPPPPGEDPMTLEMAQLIVWGWYPAILRRIPAAQSEVDYWATQLIAPGANYEQVATAFCSTPEAMAALKGGA